MKNKSRKYFNLTFYAIIFVCICFILFFAIRIAIGISNRNQYESAVNEHLKSEAVESIQNAKENLTTTNKTHAFNRWDVHELLIRRTKQKSGVHLSQLLPELDTAGIVVVHVFHKILGDDYVPTITSGNDYEYHMINSAHYRNMAIDFRIKGIPKSKRKEIVREAKRLLGSRFVVLHESPGEVMEHLHIELRPEYGASRKK